MDPRPSNFLLYRDATPIDGLSCRAALNSLQFLRHIHQDPKLENPALGQLAAQSFCCHTGRYQNPWSDWSRPLDLWSEEGVEIGKA